VSIDANGAVTVLGTPAGDYFGIIVRDGKLRVGGPNTTGVYPIASVKSISVDLGDGADTLTIGPGVGPVYCLGGLGNDTIYGGDGNDTITAGGGKDVVFGGAGDDRIDGGPTADQLTGDDGADRIYGGDANDRLDGVAGVDRLYGGEGNDTLNGGSSNDKLYGEGGEDVLYGGNQNDLLIGGASDDHLYGGAGNDTLDGQDGNDHLSGDAGNDIIGGGDGDDSLYGGAGLDQLDGKAGNDALYGQYDHDTLTGSAGADRFLQREKNNDDTITDNTSDDAVMTFVDDTATWDDDEIAQLDVGLGWLVARTHNTKLLKRSNGAEVAITRVINLGPDVLADNIGDGRIEIADLTFDFDDPAATMVHELGHNWDDVHENPTIGQFFDISRWRKRGGTWTYDTTSDFANDYGRTDPLEDFATSFEVYFSQAKGPALWMKKWTYINTFLDSMTTQ
jgi:Ca2+-binding RTX toxin-like protein